MIAATAIPLRSILDPRPPSAALHEPLADSVNIPFAELPLRTHELPPRHETIQIAAGFDESESARAWLEENGRRAALVRSSFVAAAQPGRLWRPNAFLEQCVKSLQPGRALDLACGTGRDAIYLAALGWKVTGIDVLPDALDRARDLQCRLLPAVAGISWICCNLENAAGLEQVRAAADPPFDLITCFRYLHRPLFGMIPAWLGPGGALLVETFTQTHRARHGKPRSADFVLMPDELPRLAGALDKLHYDESCREDGAHTARLWARQPRQS